MDKTVFKKLTETNVNEHIDEKASGGATKLKYLSWAWAWDYFKKECPDAKYEIKEWDGKPYLFDEKTGYMVQTSITACGETHTMWLPVMDSANHAMLDKPYTIKTKFKDISVAPATMFDINKTLMRCLVKNMAMFGLGLYIYAGEDLPEDADEKPTPKETQQKEYGAGAAHVVEIDDEIPFCDYNNADNWLTVNAFKGEMDRCATIDQISAVLNGQKGNPHINELIPLASARKQEIIATMPQ